MYLSVNCTTIYNIQDVEATWMSSDTWMDKEVTVCLTHTHRGILFSQKKEWNWDICREVDGPRVCCTEWSKLEKQVLYINAYMCNPGKNAI